MVESSDLFVKHFFSFTRNDMDKEPGSSKRRRESESSSSSGSEADSSFLQQAEAAAIPLLEMLKDCQLQLMSHENTGGTIDCCATYSFRRDIKEIKSQQMNDYGRGQLKVVRVGMDGADIHPLPEWMESRVSFQAHFERKVATNTPHSSGDSKKRGFEVPWRANIQLENIPMGCVVESFQLTFICPTGQGSPTVVIHPDHGANLYYVNDKMRNVAGQTYSECCQELGIFRQATIYVKMRVPFRLLMREQLGQLRKGFPVELPNHSVASLRGGDNVTLKSGSFSLEVFREHLCEMSEKTEKMFSENFCGKVTVYETKYGKEAVSAVVYCGTSDFDSFPLDPLAAQPSVLYEVMSLSMDWNVEPLKWVAQFALLERLCTPGFDLGRVPLAMERIWRSYMVDRTLSNVGKFLLGGFVTVLHSIRSDETKGTMPPDVQRSTWLWDEIKDVVEPVAVKLEVDPVGAAENMQPGALVPLAEYIVIRVISIEGKEIHFRVKPSSSVAKLKAELHGRFDIPSEGFRLLHEGQSGSYQPVDYGTIGDYGMEDGDVVHLRVKMVGC